jgi:molecular chaperone GrpE
MQDDSKPKTDSNPEDLGFKVHDRRFWNSSEEAPDGKRRATKPSYVVMLEERLAEKDRKLQAAVQEHRQEMEREIAESKQRIERDAKQQIRKKQGEVVLPMLEVLNTLERSIQVAQANPDPETMLQGVRNVHQLMVQKLQEIGLERIATVGAAFDPAVHEAMAITPVNSPIENNTILQEFSPGFKFGDRVVVPARVQVGKYSAS